MLAISETACPERLTRMELLEMVVIISDLDNSVEKPGTQCYVESSSMMTAGTVFVRDDVEGV